MKGGAQKCVLCMRVICAYILVMHVAWSVHLRLDLFVGGQCVLVLVLLGAVGSCSEPAFTVKIFPYSFP